MSKLIRACIAVAAFAAFAVLPASAMASNANVRLYETSGGSHVAVTTPSKITGVSTGNIDMTSSTTGGAPLVRCGKAHLEGTLEKNTAGTVEGTIEKATFEGAKELHCESELGGKTTVTTNVGNGTPWCVRSTGTMPTHQVQIRGGKCTEEAKPITFALHTANLGECRYQRTGAVIGTYTTGHPEKPIHVHHQEFVREAGSGFFCPGAGFIDMTIDLYTAGGAVPVTFT